MGIDERNDVVIVGGGIAGMIAANRAAQLNLRAVVLEQGTDEKYRCNTRYTGGTFHICLREITLDEATLRQKILESTAGFVTPELAEVIARERRGAAGRSAERARDFRWGHLGKSRSQRPHPGESPSAERRRDHLSRRHARRAGERHLPADTLKRTISEYNDAIAGKRLQSGYTPPRQTARFDACPIAKAPFHALPMCAGITYTMGGISVNAHAQALRADGGIIEGLYALGAAAGGLEGGPEVGYVGGLAKGGVTALVSAEHIAASSGQNS